MSSVFPHITLTAAESASLFFSMGVLLLTATTCGKLFEKLCLPKVVGEVLGGVMLGTTLFGNFFPNLYQQVFYGFSGQEKALGFQCHACQLVHPRHPREWRTNPHYLPEKDLTKPLINPVPSE